MSEEYRKFQLTTKEDGSIDITELAAKKAYAVTLMREKVVGSTFKTPQQVILGLELCRSMKLEPIVGMKMMYVVDGKPCLFGDGPLTLVKRTGLVSFEREFFVNKDCVEISVANKNLNDEVYAAVAQFGRKGEEGIQEDYFTLDDIKNTGVDQTKYGEKKTYKQWKRIMMRYRARTMALKSKFGDLLNTDVAEYVGNDLPKEGFYVENKDRADELTQKLVGGECQEIG